MNICKKVFSKKVKLSHIIFYIFGIKISVKNKNLHKMIQYYKALQDNYDMSRLQNAKKLIVFIIPSQEIINGGILSIFSLCETSRKIKQNNECIITTFPDDFTYTKNTLFLNNELIYRYEQITSYCQNLENLIIHIPDYLASEFYNKLSENDIIFLKKLKKLQINILNQNILLMPKTCELQTLYNLTDNVTQTIAHDRYANQEICNKWQIPTHLFSTMWDFTKYKKRTFEEKEKIIVLSPDKNDARKHIIKKLKKYFKGWEIITVKDLTYPEYMDLISRAFFSITFGEGFDGYFTQPSIVGSIGIAVYNNDFFPSDEWLNFANVFETYDELYTKICEFIKEYSENESMYNELSKNNKLLFDKYYSIKKYEDNIIRFYNEQYDFYPEKMN